MAVIKYLQFPAILPVAFWRASLMTTGVTLRPVAPIYTAERFPLKAWKSRTMKMVPVTKTHQSVAMLVWLRDVVFTKVPLGVRKAQASHVW